MLAEAAIETSNRTTVLAALQRAATATGTDFDYLLRTATRESSLNPSAQADSSSAAGLFQFVEQTWFGVVKSYGAKHGLASFANAITQGSDGRFRASNSADRAAILALRKDPQVASLMAGEFAQATRVDLEVALGRSVCGGELYAAHFLGTEAACRLIRMNDSQPNSSAATAFPAAADANRSVFYNRDGAAKTVREVYDWVVKQPNRVTRNAVPIAPKSNDASTSVAASDGLTVAETNSVLASFASRKSSHGFFKRDDSEADPWSMPIVLTLGIFDLLTAMRPVAHERVAT